jgi:hypothetical protein
MCENWRGGGGGEDSLVEGGLFTVLRFCRARGLLVAAVLVISW